MVSREPAARCALLIGLVASWGGCILDPSGLRDDGHSSGSAQGAGGAMATSGGQGGSTSVSGAGTGGGEGPADEVPEGTSTWSGYYVCSQGITSLDLAVTRDAATNDLTAIFAFAAHPTNPGVPSGSFSMVGSYEPATNHVELNGDSWIVQPGGYATVDLTGQFEPSSQKIRGEVDHSGCGEFEVGKN